jgi:hypothetical protein
MSGDIAPMPSPSAVDDSIFFYVFRIWGLYQLTILVPNIETLDTAPVDPYGRKSGTPRGLYLLRTVSEALAFRMGLDAIRLRTLYSEVALSGTGIACWNLCATVDVVIEPRTWAMTRRRFVIG